VGGTKKGRNGEVNEKLLNYSIVFLSWKSGIVSASLVFHLFQINPDHSAVAVYFFDLPQSNGKLLAIKCVLFETEL